MEPKFVTANGLRFAYLEEGTGPLVLLVHGFPDTAWTWDASMSALAKAGFRAVAPFTRGYHPTEIPADGDYTTPTRGKDLLALIEALGAETATVVGHDWGADAAYATAALEPARVKLLVTLAIPHPGGITPTPRMLWAVRHFATLRRGSAPALVRADNFALLDQLWRRWSPAWKDIPAAEIAPVKVSFAEPGVVEAAVGYYRALTVRRPECHRVKIDVPTVSFAGEHDMISTRVYEKVRHMFKKSYEVVQVPGGHFMHREHPQHFIPELVRVVGEHVR